MALSESESRKLFDLPLASDGIQPVWIEVENGSQHKYLFFPLDVDPDYYAPFELAWKYQGKVSGLDLNELGLAFHRHHVPHWVPAGATVSGFVFTKADHGAKAVTVNLMSDKDVKHFDFVVDVPGLRADYLDVDWHGLYRESETRAVDATELRRLLETLPCCALGGDKKTPGDPLNLVIIGPGAAVIAPFIRRDWDLTETIHSAAIWRTIHSSLLGRSYRTSPVSPRFNYTGDPYWTDGSRLIIELSEKPVPAAQVGYVEWAQP